MRKTVSFFILSNSGTRARQFTLSAATIRLVALMAVVTIACAGYFVYDYKQLKETVSSTINMEQTLGSQTEEITSQRKQIQQFAGELNTLKTKLLALNEFENKIMKLKLVC